MTYPNEGVARFVADHFVPVKVMVRENPPLVEQFKVRWTPTLVVEDAQGDEHDRWVGYLPPEEFLPRLKIARARIAFNLGEFEEAARRFGEIIEQHQASLVAPEAQYWWSVSRYKATGQPEELRSGWQVLYEKYPQSEWAKRVSYMFE